jgi:hypothetical protein
MSSSANVSALPWWKRPSPVWLLAFIPISSLFGSATLAPKLEIYTTVVCYIHKPDIFRDAPASWHGQQSVPLLSLSSAVDSAPFHLSAHSNPWYKACAADPDVNAEAAKLAAGASHHVSIFASSSHSPPLHAQSCQRPLGLVQSTVLPTPTLISVGS